MTTHARPQHLTQPQDLTPPRYDAGAIGALITGGLGAVFGFAGFLAVVLGDDMIALDPTSVAASGLAVLGLLAALVVRYIPGYGAIGMAAAPIGYLAAFGGSWTAWWSKYQEAVATSGAAENVFWSAMPAMALFAISGAFLAAGAVLATLSVLSGSDAQAQSA